MVKPLVADVADASAVFTDNYTAVCVYGCNADPPPAPAAPDEDATADGGRGLDLPRLLYAGEEIRLPEA